MFSLSEKNRSKKCPLLALGARNPTGLLPLSSSSSTSTTATPSLLFFSCCHFSYPRFPPSFPPRTSQTTDIGTLSPRRRPRA